MTDFFANADGTYWGGYEGPTPDAYVPSDAVPVPSPAPSPHHLWVDPDWVLDSSAEAAAKDTEASRSINGDPLVRTLFDVNFDQEKRLRAVEGKATITKAQYRNQVRALYRSFL